MKLLDILGKDAINRLRASVREKHAFEAAQVKIIGLAEICQAAGDRWAEWPDRVRTKSMYFLERRLAPDDVIVLAGDGFLIMYGDSTSADATRRADDLREALNQFFLGEEWTHP